MDFVPSTRLVQKEFESYMDKVADNVILEMPVDPYRLYFLRPSSFPYCGLRFLLEFPKKMDHPRLEGLATAYFTEVGKLVHSLFQRFTAKRGKIVGDWRCMNKKCEHHRSLVRFTVYQPCPKCGAEMLYEELEYAYKNTVLGHSDTVYRFTPKAGNKSAHAIWDYKTTSKRRVDEDKIAEMKRNKRTFPYKSNVAQIETYIPLTEAQYGIKVSYWSLIYLARDVPFMSGRRVIVKYVNDKDKELLKKRLDRTIKVHRRVLKAKTVEDVTVIRKYKMCKSLEDYKKNWRDEYDECPFVEKCFKDKEMDGLIKDTLKNNKKVFPIIATAPEGVRKAMKL